MGRKSFTAKRSQLTISRQNALKSDKNVLYTRRLKTKRHKKEKELEPDLDYIANDINVNIDPENDEQHVPFKVKELMKYKSGKPSIFKPKEIKFKDETFVKQGKKESDRNYIKRTTVDFYKAVEQSKSQKPLELDSKLKEDSQRKVKRAKRKQERQAHIREKKLDKFDGPVYEKIKFGDYVTAPPKYTVKPKVVFKN